MERLVADKRARAVACAVLSGALCVFLAMCVRISDADDDWCIALLLSDRLPATELSLFINAALSQIIHALNVAWPAVSWFYIAEDVTVWLATFMLLWAALSYCKRGPGLVLAGFAAVLLLPSCLAVSNFTFVAGYATMVGIFLLVCHVGQEGVPLVERISGIVLIALGLAWRSQMLLMALPFVFIGLAWKLLVLRRESGGLGNIAGLRQTTVSVIVALAVCAGLVVYDAAMWQQDGWAEWRSYNDARASFQDYPIPAYADVADEVSSHGLSENDYELLVSWAGSDTSVFDEETFTWIAELFEESEATATTGADALRGYLQSFASQLLLMGCVAALLVLACYRRKTTYAVAAGLLLCAFAVCVYFTYVGRLLPRVELPAWGYALAMCAALTEQCHCGTHDVRRKSFERFSRIADGLGACVFAGILVLVVWQNLPYFNPSQFFASLSQESATADSPIADAVAEHPGDTFIAAMDVVADMEAEHSYLLLPSQDVASRFVPIGGWSTNSPARNAQCAIGGGSNPYAALLEGENTYLVSGENMAQLVLVFLQEHYSPDVVCECVGDFAEGYSMFRYSVG